MVVDDDLSILVTLKKLFEPEDFNVVALENGKKCIEEMEKGFKGLLLLDIMMPEMDGWETLEILVDRHLLDNVLVSMLTARDVPDKKMEQFLEYVVDYITKPFEPDDIVNIVKDYFQYIK